PLHKVLWRPWAEKPGCRAISTALAGPSAPGRRVPYITTPPTARRDLSLAKRPTYTLTSASVGPPLRDGSASRRKEQGHPMRELVIGMDVGSTTVKAVVIDPETKAILWHDYQRHHTKQPEKVLEFLERILAEFKDQPSDAWRLFLTGSGSGPLTGPT